MARICVNQYEDYVGSDGVASFAELSTPRCIANWAHTQEQVLIAVGLWAFLLLFAAAWTFASRRQRRRLRMDELGFSLKLRRWARTSRTAALLNRPVQLATSLGIFLFMVSRCNSYEVSAVGYYCMSVLYVVALADACVRFLAARYKVLYCFAPLTMLECFMLASHCQVGFGSIKIINGVATRSWLDSSIMRPIFILRSYLEMERHLPRSSRGWMMGRLGIKVMLLIIFGASAMFFLETLGEMPFFTQNGFAHLYTCASDGSVTRDASSCEGSGETWSIMFSFYFTVVTLGTVGYGDNAPKTVLSRLLAIMFIVMGVILFSLEIENLINLYKSRQVGNPPFKPKQRDARHVVVMGNPSFAQLSSILRELFHEDHTSSTSSLGVGDDSSGGGATDSGALGGGRLHAVVLGDRNSKFTKGLVAKLEADPLFAANVTYVAGNPTRVEDLERARARDAEAVFVFPDKLSDDPANEDALNIMRVLATRRYCGPYVRCLVMVLRADSARHMLAAGVSRDDVICENVIKMGTLAQSTVSHGASTMLANLAASLSIDRSVEEEDGGASSATTAAAATKSSRDLRPSSWVLEDLAASSKNRHWLKEYYHGAAKEMYMIKLSKKYAGLTFAETASLIFNETEGNVVLIAVEVVFSGNEDAATVSTRSSDSRVLLNPGCSLIMAEWMQCYVIADDLAHVFTHRICPDEITRDEMIRVGAGSPLFNTLADTFIEPANGDGDGTVDGEGDNGERNGDSFQNVTAYASMATPHHNQQHQQHHGNGFNSTAATIESIARLREQRQDARVGHGTENVILDRSLRAVALNFRDGVDGPYGGDTLSASYASNVDTSIHVAPNYHHFSASRRISSSSVGGSSGDLSIRSLEPPPLSVLLNPRHIVVCSFLGEESLVSLQWLLLPLRGVYADSGHPPITILDAAEPSPAVAASLSAFTDVYYIQGSPLVYADLQRAGAKAAASVVVLGKRTKAGLMKSAGDETIETSIIDAEAIFCTMLIELKMDFTKIFTITELSDESNSKFLGTSFQLRHLVPGQEAAALAAHAPLDDESESSLSWWEYLLLNDIPQQKSEKAIFGLPLYMSGRLLHPELCENMLVQTFYNPSIHKIIRQLVGGPRCTGVIRSYAVSKQFQHGATYGDVFHAFAASSYAGICMGVYRLSTQKLRNGNHVELPIVLSTPEPQFRIVGSDRLFVLVGVHTLARAALCIQRFYRKFVQDHAAQPPPPQAATSSSSSSRDHGRRASRAASFLDPRSRISKYLAPQKASGFEMLSVPKSQRRSLIAQESNSSFRSYYV